MLIARFGSLVYRGRWIIIASWLIVFAVTGLIAPRVTTVLKGGGYSTPSSQSTKAFDVARRAYRYRALAFTAVFKSGGSASHRRVMIAARVFRRRVGKQFSHRIQTSHPITSEDGRIVFVRIYTRPRKDFGIPLTGKIRPLMPRRSDVSGEITGTSAIFYDMEQVSDNDLRHMEIVTFPIALLILLVIFGTLVGALLPVSMGPLTVSAALAAIFVLGHVLDMSIFVLNTASMLGLGVAIDYSLFMVQRFREELRNGMGVEAAIVATVSTAGIAITASAITVAIGFLGMTVFRVSMLTSLGIGGSVVVAISLACALTFLPALMSVLGDRVNAGSVLPASIRVAGFWSHLAEFVMRRPWQVVFGVVIVVGALAFPARELRVGVPGPDILPKSSPSRIGDTLLQRHIGIANQSPVLVVMRDPNGFKTPATKLGILSLAGRICAQPIVAGIAPSPVVDSSAGVIPCRRALRFVVRGISKASSVRHVVLASIFIHANPSSASAESFVRFLRSLPPPPGTRIFIGGQTAGQLDFDSFIYSQLPWAILFVVLSISITLAITFRSVLLPVKAVLMNGLSVLAAYGATVLVFQDGYLRGIFGFTPTGFLDSIVPIFIFCVLFGLSTDYEVFLLSRIREEYKRTQNNRHSVAYGLERTGRMITSAAIIMVVIFGAFSFADLVVIKELGLAMAAGVLVDSTLIRALLVPATMRILDRWNWWPGGVQGTQGSTTLQGQVVGGQSPLTSASQSGLD